MNLGQLDRSILIIQKSIYTGRVMNLVLSSTKSLDVREIFSHRAAFGILFVKASTAAGGFSAASCYKRVVGDITDVSVNDLKARIDAKETSGMITKFYAHYRAGDIKYFDNYLIDALI
jgi:hypothetical protein